MEYLGIKVGNGLGLGKVIFLDNVIPDDLELKVKKDEIPNELKKVDKAFKEVLKDYEKAEIETEYEDIKELAKFYKMLLSSNQLHLDIENLIKNKSYSAVGAIKERFTAEQEKLSKNDNVYIQERSNDIKDVADKILRKILKIKEVELETLTEDVILVSDEMTPSVLLSKHLEHVKGIVSEIGGKTSHVAILSSNMGIPSVFGIKNVLSVLKENELLFVDGNKGIVQTDLTNDEIKTIKRKIMKENILNQTLRKMNDKEAITKDGYKFDVAANAGDITDLNLISNINSDGIGLFRSEFLFLNRNTEPSEEYLYNVYKSFVEKMGDKPLIIRTLDIGGDKKSSYIDIGKEENPFLGYRAIRYCLDHPDFFKTSLRAILRASAHGNIMIMYPMISSVEEVRRANEILTEAKKELNKENVVHNSKIKVGIMIEIPAVALIADLLIKEVDFFSIGTNDLIQYSLAVDRGNSKVNSLYTYFNPGVIRLIKKTIDSTRNYKYKFTGMCGEMAADPLAIILLVGLGLNEFSVNISSVLKTKKLISLLKYKECKKIVTKVLKMNSSKDIEDYLDKIAKKVYGEYY